MSKKLKRLAFEAAVGHVFCETPDLTPGSEFMQWYIGEADDLPEDLVIWEPYEGTPEDMLRDVINERKDEFEMQFGLVLRAYGVSTEEENQS